MNYFEVRLYTNHAGLEAVGNRLISMGITDFVTEDPEDLKDFLDKKNSYDWDYVDESVLSLSETEPNLTFYLEYSESGRETLGIFQNALQDLKNTSEETGEEYGRLALTVQEVCDEDWRDKWKEYFKPARITERFVVKPTWEPYEKQEDTDLVIEIDPGMAFGTGTHPTTSLCIRLLEKYSASSDEVVLDVGCGSGILSIAAALLGMKTVKGVEIDPIAVDVARENVQVNHLEQQIEVFQGDLTKGLNLKADIVLANLMADLVMMLSKDVTKHLNESGLYISSGILIEKKETVAAVIKDCGFEIVEIAEEGEWCAIAARKVG